MEKGLDVFADAIDVLQRRGVPHKVVVIGEGPAREWFESRLPDANFVGFQGGADLAHALASCDIFFNPSVTETFGNVTLEAMACGLPVVAARATGSASIVKHGQTGYRSEEHTSELQSLMRISYAVFCLKKKNNKSIIHRQH